MSGFQLRWADQTIDVNASVLIGREEGCQVLLDDPLVSRRHAKIVVKDGKLWIEDLGSRNGVSLNGAKIAERQRLFGGDVLRVGKQEIVVTAATLGDPVELIEPSHPTKRFDALGVVGQLADKALGLGRPEEAERLMLPVLEQILRESQSGQFPNAELLSKSTAMVLRLLGATGHGGWIDWLVRMYAAMRRPWTADTVDHLYESGRGSAGYDRQGLRDYCDLLRKIQGELGPAERFQVGRIEGLERVLSAQ
ncbi:MAG: FHA domain-containing protein [Polyangiaceae bacterium]